MSIKVKLNISYSLHSHRYKYYWTTLGCFGGASRDFFVCCCFVFVFAQWPGQYVQVKWLCYSAQVSKPVLGLATIVMHLKLSHTSPPKLKKSYNCLCRGIQAAVIIGANKHKPWQKRLCNFNSILWDDVRWHCFALSLQ